MSQLNRQARSLLESHFDFVWVTGEISNFAAPSSGHWYFSLKDGSAQVRCAMFRNRNQRMRFTPGNGDSIRLRGRVSLYEGRGEFQLIAEHMEPEGAGALQAAFELLKSRLAAEGLFEPDRKLVLPTNIKHLCIITSPTGAAIHDILTVLKRRAPGIAISLLPVAVQGSAAAGEISQAIARANRWQDEGKIQFDALIVGRGGGSLEDLWAFNEEIVARAIAASEIPIVSAVGHEVDFSIADMVADHRAATPSAAAEMLSPDQRELLGKLSAIETALARQIGQNIHRAGTHLTHLRRRLKHPGYILREQAQRLDDLEQRLLFAQNTAFRHRKNRLALLTSRLHSRSPFQRLTQLETQLSHIRFRLEKSTADKLRGASAQLQQISHRLDALSPLKILSRGYAIITDDEGKVVKNAANTQVGQVLKAKLAEGELALEVTASLPSNKD